MDRDQGDPAGRENSGNSMDGKGIQVCKIQNDAGQYYLWETQSGHQDVALMDSVKSNGGAHVKIGNRRLWSNRRAIVGKLQKRSGGDEVGSRLVSSQRRNPGEEVIHEATLVQEEKEKESGCHRRNQAG